MAKACSRRLSHIRLAVVLSRSYFHFRLSQRRVTSPSPSLIPVAEAWNPYGRGWGAGALGEAPYHQCPPKKQDPQGVHGAQSCPGEIGGEVEGLPEGLWAAARSPGVRRLPGSLGLSLPGKAHVRMGATCFTRMLTLSTNPHGNS